MSRLNISYIIKVQFMKKKLVPIGNGWSIYMPVHILKLMGVDPKNSNVLFDIEDKTLLVKEIAPNNPDVNKLLIRRFIRSGHGFALYIPNTILELLDVNPENDLVSLEINKQTLIIKKA